MSWVCLGVKHPSWVRAGATQLGPPCFPHPPDELLYLVNEPNSVAFVHKTRDDSALTMNEMNE